MRLKSALALITAIAAVGFAAALWTPAKAMGPVGPSAANKAENSIVEQVRRWRRGYYRSYGYYPRYRYRYRPYYYSGYYPYYYRPYRPYYYGGYYGGPRLYGWGWGPRFGLRIGW